MPFKRNWNFNLVGGVDSCWYHDDQYQHNKNWPAKLAALFEGRKVGNHTSK